VRAGQYKRSVNDLHPTIDLKPTVLVHPRNRERSEPKNGWLHLLKMRPRRPLIDRTAATLRPNGLLLSPQTNA
jgi:hypothetical protein